jgi:hypothetical protein
VLNVESDDSGNLERDSETMTTELTKEIELEILSAIRNIRYGSVEIVIHNSKVVQIERKEKVRLANNGEEKRR